MAVPRWLIITFLVVSFLGFLDAAYLTIEHYRSGGASCTLTSCADVTTSEYAAILGVPVALLGALYYLAIFWLTFYALTERREAVFRFTARLTVLGLLASIYFVSVMAFVLKAWCLYCLGSAVTSTTLFVLGLFVLRRIHEGHRAFGVGHSDGSNDRLRPTP